MDEPMRDPARAAGGPDGRRGSRTAGDPRSPVERRRTTFEPSRLFLGVCLLAIAAGFAARAAGHLEIRLLVLAVALPVTLALTAVIAIVTHQVRRNR